MPNYTFATTCYVTQYADTEDEAQQLTRKALADMDEDIVVTNGLSIYIPPSSELTLDEIYESPCLTSPPNNENPFGPAPSTG